MHSKNGLNSPLEPENLGKERLVARPEVAHPRQHTRHVAYLTTQKNATATMWDIKDEKEASGEEIVLGSEDALLMYEADYGLLPSSHPLVQLVRKRLKQLAPNVPEQELPNVQVLASTGEGVNAAAFANNTILVTPELLQFVETEEELDGVLLHEAEHLWQKHLKMQNQRKGGSINRTLGTVRHQEYDADMRAFYDASDPRRQTSPLGLIRFLERLREKERQFEKKTGTMTWGIVHGETTDRILNLKSALRLLDLLDVTQNEHSLTQMDDTVRQQLHDLPLGGNVTRLLQSPPTEARYWGNWVTEMGRILNGADWKLLQVVMADMVKKIEELEQEVAKAQEQSLRGMVQTKADHLQSYTMLLQRSLQRWNELFEKRYSHLEGEQKEKMRAFLLEAAVELTIVSEPEKPLWRKMRLGTLAASTKGWKDEKTCLEDVQACLENVASPIRRGQTFGFIAKVAAHSIGPAAAFDDDKGVRAEDFLKQVAELIKVGKQVDQYKGVGAPRKTALTADAAWHESVGSALVTLADQDALEPIFAESIRAAANESGLPQTFPMWKSMELITAWQETGAQVAESLRTFFAENTQLVTDTHIDLKVEMQRLWEMYADIQRNREIGIDTDAIYQEAKKAVTENRARYTFLLEDKAMPIEQKILFEFSHMLQRKREVLDCSGTHLSTVASIAHTLRSLPQDIPNDLVVDHAPHLIVATSPVPRGRLVEEMMTQLFRLPEPEKTTTDIADEDDDDERGHVSHMNWRVGIPWTYASVGSLAEYQRLVTELIDARTMSGYVEIMECVTLANGPQNEALHRENLLDVQPNFLAEDVQWQAHALRAFAKHVQSLGSEGEFYAALEQFVDLWPVSQAFALSASRSHVIEAGLKYINLDHAATDPLVRKRLLQLSFFLTDTTIRKPLQDYLTQEDVATSEFPEAVAAVFERHKSQKSVESANALDYLVEEKAQTPQQIEQLRDRCLAVVSAHPSADRLGKSVVFDTLWHTIFRRSDRAELLRALLSSHGDEELLRERLEAGWHMRYHEDIDNHIVAKAEQLDTVEDLQQFATERPWANAEGIIDLGGGDEVVSLETMRRALYRLGSPERHMLLRKLMSGERGVLATEGRRGEMLDDFFRVYVHSEGDQTLTGVLKEIFGSFINAAPADELFIMLEPLLRPRIAIPPSNPRNWHPEAAHRAFEAAQQGRPSDDLARAITGDSPEFEALQAQEPFCWKYEGKEYEDLTAEQRVLLPLIEDRIRFFMNPSERGIAAQAASAERLSAVVPSRFFYQEAKTIEPMELVLDIARQLGAPGVRFLQLLGQTLDIPEQYRAKFLEVYDSLRGQSKLAAWETVRREAPEFSPHVDRFKRRIGGGSLYTVYDTETDDQQLPREVTKVMNPNALYHAQFSLQIMRDALTRLAEEKNGHYKQAVPLLDVIEEWIVSELNDVKFEESDIAFRKKWQGWKPNRSFGLSVHIPTSKPTGTVKVRRDEYAEGKNFTLMNEFDPAERKEVVALAVQHYIGQLGGTMDYLLKEKVLVHSDISVGNLRYNPEKKQLSILDRAMYLEFSREDRSFLKELADVADVSGIARKIVDWLWVNPENQQAISSLKKEDVIGAILGRVQARGSDQETAAIDAMVAVHENGLQVPLRFMLLFKNFNALRQMALQAGFSSLKEAAQYSPKK